MTISPSELYPLDDKQLLERLGGAQSGSPLDHAVQMEFQRRAFVATAEAARETASSAKWTKWTAVASAISAGAAAISAIAAVILIFNAS